MDKEQMNKMVLRIQEAVRNANHKHNSAIRDKIQAAREKEISGSKGLKKLQEFCNNYKKGDLRIYKTGFGEMIHLFLLQESEEYRKAHNRMRFTPNSLYIEGLINKGNSERDIIKLLTS